MSELLSIIGLLLLFVITIFLMVILHELGHASVIMAVSDKPVIIYIGSYKNKTKSFQIKTGMLTIHIKYNPFTWARGLCSSPDSKISINHRILYVAAGPVVSIFTGLIALHFFGLVSRGILRSDLMFFGVSSVITGIANLYPRTLSKRTADGNVIVTDGYSLVKLFRIKFLPPEYGIATEYFNNKQYAESAASIQGIIDKGIINKHIWRLAIGANAQANNIETGDKLSAVFLKKYIPDSNDYCTAGYLKTKLKLEDEAYGLYKKSLSLNARNTYALNNIGHSLIVMQRYPEAIQYLEAAISESPHFCHAHSNLAFAKISTGELDEGFQSIQDCFDIDPGFGGAFTSLGYYHLKKGELDDAKRCFEKSKEIEPDDDSNDEFLRELEVMNNKETA